MRPKVIEESLKERSFDDRMEWTLHTTWAAIDDMRMDHGGAQVPMTQELLNRADVIPRLQKQSCERMSGSMAAHQFRNADREHGRLTHVSLEHRLVQMMLPALSGG